MQNKKHENDCDYQGGGNQDCDWPDDYTYIYGTNYYEKSNVETVGNFPKV